jgi:hypothetical protein
LVKFGSLVWILPQAIEPSVLRKCTVLWLLAMLRHFLQLT